MKKEWKGLLIKGIAVVLFLVLTSMNWHVSYMKGAELDNYVNQLKTLLGGDTLLGKPLGFWMIMIHHVIDYFILGILAYLSTRTDSMAEIQNMLIAILVVFFVSVSDELIKCFGSSFDVVLKYFVIKLVAATVGILIMAAVRSLINHGHNKRHI